MDNIQISPPSLENPQWQKILEIANFSPFWPSLLPKGTAISEIIFRPEKANGDYPRCSLKISLEASDKKLCIKQFNYDWASPAYDCPSLWKNHIKFSHIDTPEPIPYLIRESLLWIGFNYKNQKAASITCSRTQIEISVLEGDLSREEFIQLSKGFIPIDESHLKEINSKTYAELSFGYSVLVQSINVPISFWKVPINEIQYQQAFKLEESLYQPEESYDCTKIKDYKLNSIFVYQASKEAMPKKRIEFVYEHTQIPGATLRLIKAHKNSKLLNFPPEPDLTQKFFHEKLTLKDKLVYLAYRHAEYGPFEACWENDSCNFLLLMKPTPVTTKKYFLNCLGSLFQK